MNFDWTTKTLDEVCTFSNGLWKGEKPPFVTVGVIRNTNFTKEGNLDDSDIAVLEVEERKFEKRQLKFGDIILEKSGGGPKQPVGRVALFDKSEGLFSFSNFTSALRVSYPAEIDYRFLHKFLHWIYVRGDTEPMQSHSTGIRNLNGDLYKAIKFSFPPIPEQRRIVALLDEAFEGLAIATANTEKNLKNARDIFESYQQSIFLGEKGKWEIIELGQICEFENGDRGSNYPHRSEYVSSGIPWINTGHIQFDGTLNNSTMNYITLEKFNSLRSGKIRLGDLVYCLRGATLGKTALVAPYSIGAVASSLVIIRPKPLLNSHFLYFFLTSQLGQSLIGQYENGAAQPNLGAKNVAKFKIAVPSLEQQNLLVEDLDSLREKTISLADFYKSKLAAIVEFKQSLLQKAFAGKLTMDFRPSVVASSAASTVSSLSTADLHAGVLAMAYDRHHRRSTHKTFGRVKGQKFLHLVESVGRIDLGRAPIKDAAGPNDFQHMLRAEDWARQSEFFEFAQRPSGNGYEFKKLQHFYEQLKQSIVSLEPFRAELNKIIDLIIDMNSEEAELFATVHAAWNNLIIDKVPITDQAIVREARENWHKDKLKIPEQRFHDALNSIRTRKLEPDGTAKYVVGQSRLI